ncbi:MAG: OmpA family protein [Akkermansiaceae bacterium]|jgi:OmpA-OmpF porin, OOP family|nr:OmpA family protein [Akkermansiaceae bacterium]MDP4645533.1 OmpA family protein [Akkermansiaceae bacterium]MDP4721886.1 OmpA family protein [Akkermansiaceae bacterium]MDP4778655.1 OmpA family protein [Akkermansiaceae bacterium]MDP4847800.1 OmpA family protein [Akkermansiaceae bacterium]
MEQEYRWSDTRDADTYRLPGQEHLGRWAVAAMLVSILLHVVVFFALDHVKIALGIQQPEDYSTEPVNIRQVEVKSYERDQEIPEEETITPPDDSAALLEEVDLLDMLPEDVEIDMSTEIIDPEYALTMTDPLAEGTLEAIEETISAGFEMEDNFPELGRMEEQLEPAAMGQITVDPGAMQLDDGELSSFTDELLKRGNDGLVSEGKLDGVESLDQLLDLPPNLLLSKKTLLPSDLLFEFNRAELRESAKIGLMKLALLMDRNPNLYCWIEGHTDLIGTDEANILLSKRRAEAVKSYLVESMRMNPERIITRGFGESDPLVPSGDADRQAPNRRVEIRMRKTPPPDEPIKVKPKAQPVPEPEPEPMPDPPKAILIRPNVEPEPVPEPPKAMIIEEEPAPLKAQPVEEPPVPRAQPVD